MLIHVKVQTQRKRNFAKCMDLYNTRIFDRYNRTVVSLAVLADNSPNWRLGPPPTSAEDPRSNGSIYSRHRKSR